MTVKTIKASGGDYSSVTAFEAAAPATLTSTWEGACDNFSSTEAVAFSGITTSATNYVRLYADTGAHNDGRSRAVSGTGFRMTSTTNGTIRVGINHFRIEGIELENTGSGTNALQMNGPFTAGGNDIRIDSSIIHDTATGSGYTCSFPTANLNLTLTNDIIYGFQRTWDTRGAASVTAYNCNLWRHAAQLGAVSGSELVAKNCYSGHATGTANDWNPSSGTPTGSNNAASDTTATSGAFTSSINSVAGSSVFTSVTAGAEDFTLKSGTNALVDAGTSSGAPSVDIIGTSRPQGSAFDIGAFERLSAALSIFADFVSSIEFQSALKRESIAQVESVGLLQRDSVTPVDIGTLLRSDVVATPETAVRLQADMLSPDEFGISVSYDCVSPITEGATVKADAIAPVAWDGTIAVSINGDAVAPIEFVTGIKNTTRSAIAIVSNLMADTVVNAATQTQLKKDVLGLVETAIGLGYHFTAPVEIEASIAGLSRIRISWTTDAPALVATVTLQASQVTISLKANQSDIILKGKI